MNAVLTYEEIIFSRKNKDYGAYILRKNYKRNVVISVVVTIITFTLAVSAPLFIKGSDANGGSISNGGVVTFDPIPNLENNDNTVTDVTPVKSLKPTIAFKVPKVVEDENAASTEMPTIPELLNKLPSTTTVDGDPTGKEIITEIPNEIMIIKEPVKLEHFIWAEEMPRYSKGEEALMEFLSKNIHYPEIAKRAGVEGKVYLNFIVERDGSLSDITVLKGIGAGCDEEAVRAVKLLDTWIPGRQNGNTVRVKISFPIIFKLN